MSKSVGIVAEYNPFHTGHKYQIDFLRSIGYEAVVCAMSGSCVQRGELALISKFARAEMALCAGADLVCEIPFPFSARSAEGFARAGVQTLNALKVDAICFGSESQQIDILKNIAAYLLTPEYSSDLKDGLKLKLPYAVARQKAILKRFPLEKEFLTASNDILAIEYIKACYEMNWQPKFIALKRKGAAYNQLSSIDGYSSASGIRKLIGEYKADSACEFVPQCCRDVFKRQLDRGSYFTADDAFEKAVLWALRGKSAEDFALAADCNKELSHAFEKAVSKAESLDELMDLLPTKQYTRSRLCRIMLSVFLSEKDDFPKDIQYVRILAMDSIGERKLKSSAADCPLPISHSIKILGKLNPICKKICDAEAKATDAFNSFSKIIGAPRADYTAKIIKK